MGAQQALTHTAGAYVPIDVPHKSMSVHGEIPMLRENASASGCFHVRAIQADVMDYVVNGSVGWELDENGRGVGRHFKKNEDPTLVRPGLSGPVFRTTLVEGHDRTWYLVELCESAAVLIQLDAEFYDLKGTRKVIINPTDAEQDSLQIHGWVS